MATPRTAPSTRKPAGAKVDFDLDELEVQPDKPLVVKIGGRAIQLMSVADLDWQVVAALSAIPPAEAIGQLVREEDKEHFYAQHFSMKKLDALFKFYLDHFGIDVGEFGA